MKDTGPHILWSAKRRCVDKDKCPSALVQLYSATILGISTRYIISLISLINICDFVNNIVTLGAQSHL